MGTIRTNLDVPQSIAGRPGGWSHWLRPPGLEERILIAMMTMLVSAVGIVSLLWSLDMDRQVNALLGEQARQIGLAVAPGAQAAIATKNGDALMRIAERSLGMRNVLFVAFYDGQGNRLADSEQPGISLAEKHLSEHDVTLLTRVLRRSAENVGNYLQVFSPVIDYSHNNEPRLLGYDSVAILTSIEQAQVHRVSVVVVATACVLVLVSAPLVYLLIRHIFQPIRNLVDATRKIADGDLEARVAIDRTDAIGTLARAFNEMVQTIRRQRQDLVCANLELEDKVAQRTEELEGANRRLSAEIAEKEDFLRAVSHDLNAPLRNISGMATMLLLKHGATLDEDVVQRLERIQRNVETETGLISELLELSRIKTRREKMEMLETGAVIRELEDLFENDLQSRKISLIVDTPLPVVRGERVRFRQVFQNLIDNAIKYMGDGVVREIHIGCRFHPNEAEFYVRDTGLGIDAEDITKVFFIFRRGKNGASRNIPGKGVGLSSVKSIVETYGGTINVHSTPGEGSTFCFTIHGQYLPALAQSARGEAPSGIQQGAGI